tara:strand:- start:357 stop:905 length:549 start_codon:yes stop_codon:yes gene_type:complete
MADEIPLTGKNKSIDHLITQINKMKRSDLDTTQLEKQLNIKKAAFPKLFKGTKEYQKAKELKAKGGMIRKYKTGGTANGKKKPIQKSLLKKFGSKIPYVGWGITAKDVAIHGPGFIKRLIHDTLKKETRKKGISHIGKKKKTQKESLGLKKGGIIRKYNTGGFIARGCGKVMNNRRKKTKIY